MLLRLGGCHNPLFVPAYGTLILHFEPSTIAHRTFMPSAAETEIASYTISGRGPDDAVFAYADLPGTELVKSELTPGTWSVTVSGKNSESLTVASGSASVDVVGGQSTSVDVPLRPVAGIGTLTMAVRWPTASFARPSLTAKLVPRLGDGIEIAFPAAVISSVQSLSSVVYEDSRPSGAYTLIIQLSEDGMPVASAVEALIVYAGLTTEASFVLSEQDINLLPEQDSKVVHVNSAGAADFGYTTDLGPRSRDVYFVFTNTGFRDAVTRPTVKAVQPSDKSTGVLPQPQGLWEDAGGPRNVGIRGRADVSRFNANPRAFVTPGPSSAVTAKSLLPTPPRRDTVGEAQDFMYDWYAAYTLPATCRKVVEAVPVAAGGTVAGGTRTLNIWVADDCWFEGGTRAKLVTQEMVDLVADKFLTEGANNDIYDWVTNILGPEWGESDEPGMIPADGTITILLYDIDYDNSTEGGVLGFFWSKDNFLQSSTAISNERIMFYLDAVMFSTQDGPSWDPNDYWPQETLSALGHELQHMIHYYQKSFVYSPYSRNSETWIDEMVSLAVEDLLAEKLDVMGPRGLPGTQASAGDPGIATGLLRQRA